MPFFFYDFVFFGMNFEIEHTKKRTWTKKGRNAKRKGHMIWTIGGTCQVPLERRVHGTFYIEEIGAILCRAAQYLTKIILLFITVSYINEKLLKHL